ncbi:pyridoxal phosphate-dependent decarboxylase family protein [Piscinibacter terrae]|uniref:pyridoxal phosphate-dependent decarboxylase family protein n=1 Tax=Piscinibacter terrae TaxID=2496871 RepID=UPI00138728FD|nr:aminotransferase class I/II-fold pyridoxal phosphate-dependent enzyme [Albitalea terrae]
MLGDVTPQAFAKAVSRVGDSQQQKPMQRAVQVIDAAGAAALRNMGVPAKGRPLNDVLTQLLEDIHPWRAKMDHPRFFAFIPGPASPLSALGELATAMHNAHAGSWLQSSGASAIEMGLIEWLASRVGLPATAGGLFVSGGSMANLTALTVARDQKLAPHERSIAVAYVSEQTHSSVAKGLKIIGFLPDQIRRMPTDDAFAMDMAALACAMEQDRAAGLKPFVVIASAGTTNTGSVDPLRAIRALCDQHGLWMHVDGAYGASAALSPAHRGLLDGIGEADSLSWDAHKWLFQTYGCGMVLMRHREHLPQSFHTRPEYLRDAQTDADQVNHWDLGAELTRPARAMKLWLTLQVLGSQAMGDAIAHGCQLAQWAEDELRQHAGWDVVSPAQLAIVTFRMTQPGLSPEDTDALNRAISRRALEDGFAAVLTTQLKGRTVLRICAIHPDATELDMRETIRRLDAYGRESAMALTL